MLHFYNSYEANKGLPISPRPKYTGEGLQVPGVVVDTVEIVGDGYCFPQDKTNRQLQWPGARETLLSWWNLYCNSKNHHPSAESRSSLTPAKCGEYDEFCRLVLGEFIRDSQNRPERPATIEDREKVAGYLNTGNQNYTIYIVLNQLKNRRFFVTRLGLIGLGHLHTTPGDEVWVLNHGRVPFTLRTKGKPTSSSVKDHEDYIFVGHCYVEGIMQGLSTDGQTSTDPRQRIVCLH